MVRTQEKGYQTRNKVIREILYLRDEFEDVVGIGIEGVGTFEEVSFGVNDYVERLGVRSEFVSLQQAPFVTDGTYFVFSTVFNN